MNFKYISFVDGPLAKYRLDIFLNSSPNLAEHYLFFCTEFSYNLYKDYHSKLEFIIIDDERSKFTSSLERECFINVETEREWLANINNFYGVEIGKFYPYEFHRFALPILAKRKILNFCIVDTDVLTHPDSNIHKNIFNSIKPGFFYGHIFTGSSIRKAKTSFFTDTLKNRHGYVFHKRTDDFNELDGNIRGFHFKSVEDMLNFFRVWNDAVLTCLQLKDRELPGSGNKIFNHMEWIISYLMQYTVDYKLVDYRQFFYYKGMDTIIHKTRVEDTIYIGPRSQWEHYNFNYEDTSTIAAFIQNNKSQLEKYWREHVPVVEITDTHIFTKIS